MKGYYFSVEENELLNKIHNKNVKFITRQTNLLIYLLSNNNKFSPQEEIIKHLNTFESYSNNNFKNDISYIRKQFEKNYFDINIVCRNGIGYKILLKEQIILSDSTLLIDNSKNPKNHLIEIGNFTLDLLNYELINCITEKNHKLTNIEFEILLFLAKNKNKIINRNELEAFFDLDRNRFNSILSILKKKFQADKDIFLGDLRSKLYELPSFYSHPFYLNFFQGHKPNGKLIFLTAPFLEVINNIEQCQPLT